MNFSYGVMAAVGVLIAISLGLIAAAPGDIPEPREILAEKQTACTMEYVPVCGVDGQTYGNMCTLNASDVELSHEGECGVDDPIVKPRIMAENIAESVEEKLSTLTDHSEVTIGTAEESGFSQECAPDNCYIPGTATVDVGGTVIMTNTDTTGVHTFTSGTVDGFTPSPDGVFDSAILMSGDSFEWVPDTVGDYPYYCMLHTWMIGNIIVQEAETMEAETMEAETMEAETMEEAMETPEPVEDTSESMALTISIPQGTGAPGCETTLECYLPYEVTVKAGTTITWINEDTTVHTVTSGKITKGTTGLFDSSIFTSGNTFEFTFNTPGTYDYFCNVHPWMAGIVHVN